MVIGPTINLFPKNLFIEQMLDIIPCVGDTVVNRADKTHGTYILLGETDNIKKARSAMGESKQKLRLKTSGSIEKFYEAI